MAEENKKDEQKAQDPEESTSKEENSEEKGDSVAEEAKESAQASDEVAESSGEEATTSSEEKTEMPADTKEEDASEEDVASEGEEVEVPEKFKAIVDQIEQMSVLDLNELVKVLEKKFGVSAAAAAVPAGDGAEAGGAEEEQTSFNVELVSFGDQKVSVIKVVKEILGLGLKEAKEFVEGAPKAIKEGIGKDEADEIKGKIDEAGGQVEIK